LVKEILAGRTERYGELVLAYQSMLTSFAAWRLPDPHMVDEVVQQTFVRAYEQLAEFDPQSDFGTWLRVICHYFILTEQKRAVLDLQNRTRYRERVRHHLMQASAERAGIDPQRHAEDRLSLLRECRGKLPADLEKLVKLRYEEERRIADIAAHLERTESWVTMTLWRIRGLLRDCMDRRLASGEA
jgi:RNA polymerase sigma-70 factor (ECF subfamily)